MIKYMRCLGLGVVVTTALAFSGTANAFIILAPNCQHVLSYKSTDFANKGKDTTKSILANLQIYTDCYKQRIKRLKQKAMSSNYAPLMGQRARFRDFQKGLNQYVRGINMAHKGMGTYSAVSAAYVNLYKLQFADYFYRKQVHAPQSDNWVKVANNKDMEQIFAAVKTITIMSEQQGLRNHYTSEGAKQMLLTNDGDMFPMMKIYNFMLYTMQSPGDKPHSAAPF